MKCWLFLLCALMIGLVGCASPGGSSPMGAADERFTAMLSPAQARPDSQIGRYVQEVGGRLRNGARALVDNHDWPSGLARPADWMLRDVQFHLVEGAAPNAFTSSGPHIYATSGLLRACGSEDEFAAALAHAYAHILCRHAPVLPAPSAEAGGDARLAIEYVSFHYSPDQERQADDLAIAILTRGGWLSEAYATMMETSAGSAKRVGQLRARLSDVSQRLGAILPIATDWRLPPVADRKRFAANQKLAANVSWETAGDPALLKRARLIVAAYPNCFTGEDTAEQIRARNELLPPPAPPPEDNPWGKGLPAPR